MFSLQIIVVAMSVFSSAAVAGIAGKRSGPGDLSVGEASTQCGNGQVIACCNSKDGGDGLLNNLLGGNCQQLNIPIVAIPIQDNHACGSQTAACCTGDQAGLVNVQCTPINILSK